MNKHKVLLEEQYRYIYSLLEKYSPELCLKLGCITDVEQFHHNLWIMPFYKSIHIVHENKYFYKENNVYCSVSDNKRYIDKLFVIDVWESLRIKIFNKKINNKVFKRIINPDDCDFEEYFKIILTTNPKTIYEIDNAVKNKFLKELLKQT